ncbi:MAG: dipeptidase [Planctomycetaceae bacterium]|nr:dipeptidase [Planctomycetaceae bacterium]
MKRIPVTIVLGAVSVWAMARGAADACTNFLVTKGASADGSTMISYSADSHVLYGELYHWPAATWEEGTLLEVHEWDTGKYLGRIPQARQTYNVVGNINEHQVAISETTFGGREELSSQPGACMDYGSLIYIALQRASTARQAIQIMTDLVQEHGYYSSGESFSIADPDEVWIMEMIGKGEGNQGAVWVALRVPDGYISGHANHARIRTFPLADGRTSITSQQFELFDEPAVEVIYAHDVISFARDKNWFAGEDQDFSFSDVYAPLDFQSARFCEARVWAIFRQVHDGMDQYVDYALGRDLTRRMPLWIQPQRKVTVNDMFAFMRNTFEGTPLDMSQDIGAGPYALPYRWRPLTWTVDGQKYLNERAVATQQTGFVFVAQSRSWLPDPVGGILWFGVDDAKSTVFVPMYGSITRAPHSYAVGNGDMMTWSDDAAFWVFNQVSNLAYTRYRDIIADVQGVQQELEGKFLADTPAVDKAAETLYQEDPQRAVEYLTEYSVQQGDETVQRWRELYRQLFVKYLDGNIKSVNPPHRNPKVEQSGYGEAWYRRIISEKGDQLKVPQ